MPNPLEHRSCAPPRRKAVTETRRCPTLGACVRAGPGWLICQSHADVQAHTLRVLRWFTDSVTRLLLPADNTR